MIGCKLICFFGEVPPRHERTKKKPYAGGNRAGTACRQTDTEEEPGKLAERTSQVLFNDAVNGSYDQAVLAVSDVGLNKALQEAVNEIDQHLEWLMEPERIADFRTRKYAEEQILCLRKNIIGAIKSLLSRGTQFFYIPEVKKAAMEQIKEDSRPSVLQKLHRRQEEIHQREQICTKPKKRSHGIEL